MLAAAAMACASRSGYRWWWVYDASAPLFGRWILRRLDGRDVYAARSTWADGYGPHLP
jgi:hypothetical protein